MADEIVPFGKYKGKSVDVLAADRGYCEWLAGQDWFRVRFAAMHALLLDGGTLSDETPEHNAMQARFLDDAYCVAVAGAVEPLLADDPRAWLVPDFPGAIVGLDDLADRMVSDKQFEARGWDVVFDVRNGFGMTYRRESDRHDNWTWFGKRMRVYIECKPSLGDDYPKVLRQVKSYGAVPFRAEHLPCSHVLLVDRLCCTGVGRDQLKEIFLLSGIRVIFSGDVSDGR